MVRKKPVADDKIIADVIQHTKDTHKNQAKLIDVLATFDEFKSISNIG